MIADAISAQARCPEVMDRLDRSRAQGRKIARAKGRQSKLSKEQWDDLKEYALLKPRTMAELRSWMLRFTGQQFSDGHWSNWLRGEKIEFIRMVNGYDA